ncbi:MAG TPA: hypothetical protein VGE02_14830 [Gemmatimonadales bacterium]
MTRPAGAEQHDRARLDAAVARLEGQHVVAGESIVGVGGGARADVDHDRRRHQPLPRDLIGRRPVLGEVHRRV